MSVSTGSLRAYLIKLFLNQTLITEVYLQNSNQPQGTPDLTGVRVAEVGLDYVTFTQLGSAGGTLYYVNLDKILLIDL
jgi:hypothetical protein